MIRIGVISDTHLTDTAESSALLQCIAADCFRDVEMVIHAGDVVDPAVLTIFTPCPVYGVRGNMDPSSANLPYKRILQVEGVRIGVIHGWGSADRLVERIFREFAETPVDCLVFGHSHTPMCRHEDGVLLFNPGSATDRRGMPWESVGILEVSHGTVNGRILRLGR